MNRVELSWRDSEPPAWAEQVESYLLSAMEAVGVDDWELSVLFCGDDFIKELNRDYRGLDEPTDVLSFGMGERIKDGDREYYLAGDIVVSLPALARNVEAFSVSQDEELKRLLVHGLLHLSGMDHEDNEPSRPMLRKQEELLALLPRGRIL